MKRYETISQNIKDSYLDHPTRSQLIRIELCNLCHSDLYNSEDYAHLYQVSLDGINIRIMQFECAYGPQNRPGFRTIGFVEGRKILTEFIIFKTDSYVFDYRVILNAFVFGR